MAYEDIRVQARATALEAYVGAGGQSLVRAAAYIEDGISDYGSMLQSGDPHQRKSGLEVMRQRGLSARARELA